MLKRLSTVTAVIVTLFGFALPAHAQESVVAKAKADLAAAGVQVENVACSDFEIAKVVAGRVPGAGLLTKDCCGDANDPNRSHCEYNGVWYAHDIVAFADGSIADIAEDGGGKNAPRWGLDAPDPGLVSRYRSAASLGLTGKVAGIPGPGPVTPPVIPDGESLKAQIAALTERVNRLVAQWSEAELNHGAAMKTLEAALSEETDWRKEHQEAIRVDLEALRQQLQNLHIPTGCRVQWLACRLTP